MEKVAKLLGLSENATEEEIVAKIEEVQKEKDEIKKENATLLQTNNTLAVSEAGKQARIDELEKEHKELLEKAVIVEPKEEKSDIEKLVDIE